MRRLASISGHLVTPVLTKRGLAMRWERSAVAGAEFAFAECWAPRELRLAPPSAFLGEHAFMPAAEHKIGEKRKRSKDRDTRDRQKDQRGEHTGYVEAIPRFSNPIASPEPAPAEPAAISATTAPMSASPRDAIG